MSKDQKAMTNSQPEQTNQNQVRSVVIDALSLACWE